MAPRKHRSSPQFSGRYISFYKENNWEYVCRNNCTGIVIILAKTEDDRVLLVEQFRPPVNKCVIEYPAGLVNDLKHKKNESVLTAAKRELLEETGYKAKKIFKVVEGPVSSGLTSDLVTIVMATGLKKVTQGGGDDTEKIKVHEIPLSKIEGWLKLKTRQGLLLDPKVYAGLYFFYKYNGLSSRTK